MPTEELPGGHCSKVYADDARVLKAPFQGEEMTSGFWATQELAKNVGPRVFESDCETATTLMERLRPGSKLAELNLSDEEAIAITVDLIRQIEPLETNRCVSLAEYWSSTDPLCQQLLDTTDRQVFLHGDLHHENILRHGDRWMVIDPKGILGDPAFEPTAFLRNPIGAMPSHPEPESVLRNRINLFAQSLNLDPWRICAWSLVDIRSWDEGEWKRVVEALERIEQDLR